MADQSANDHRLTAVLEGIAARGAIGERSLPVAISHAEEFAAAVPVDAHVVVDLGSGGGLPGLVVAVRRPELQIVLVERRRTRADMLVRAVRALGVDDRVRVVADDVQVLVPELGGTVDAVTARSFAAPPVTLRWAGELLRTGGVAVVSEPPADEPDRWPTELLEARGFEDVGRQGRVRVFRRR